MKRVKIRLLCFKIRMGQWYRNHLGKHMPKIHRPLPEACCPNCGKKCNVCTKFAYDEVIGYAIVCSDDEECGYSSGMARTEEEALARHNSMALASMKELDE